MVAYKVVNSLLPIPVYKIFITGFETMSQVKSITYDDKSIQFILKLLILYLVEKTIFLFYPQYLIVLLKMVMV